MPSKSGKQHRFMEMCAHTPAHAKGKCPSEKISREFVKADQAAGKSFKKRKGT